MRHIFHKFVNEGKGTHVIARELKEEGISPMRCDEWSCTVLLRILKNEKYCGDLVQKKTYTPDYLSHEKKHNRGQEEFVILWDHHEPIISREMFEAAGRILDSRAESQVARNPRWINPSTAIVIAFRARSSAASAAGAMWPVTVPALTAAGTRHGVVWKLPATESSTRMQRAMC